jgi:hypothetical protein
MSEFIPVEAPEIEEEEGVEVPSTGIDGYIRPILYSTTDDPVEIINLDAGNLRVDNDAIIKNNLIVSGITTIGIGSTSSPSNSSFSFELTDNATLTIRVKGTDGTVRVGIVTLT